MFIFIGSELNSYTGRYLSFRTLRYIEQPRTLCRIFLVHYVLCCHAKEGHALSSGFCLAYGEKDGKDFGTTVSGIVGGLLLLLCSKHEIVCVLKNRPRPMCNHPHQTIRCATTSCEKIVSSWESTKY